jgi:hypothetical protein
MRDRLTMPELLHRADYIEAETEVAVSMIYDWVLKDERSPTIEELKALTAVLTSHRAVTHEALESPTRCEGKFIKAREKLVADFYGRGEA